MSVVTDQLLATDISGPIERPNFYRGFYRVGEMLCQKCDNDKSTGGVLIYFVQ